VQRATKGRKNGSFLGTQNRGQRWLSSANDYLNAITTIDCGYMERNDYAYAYLLRNGKHAAFIDNNTNHCVPTMMQALADQGLQPENVDYIIITHVHLDHAGATGQLAELCPNAQVLAHPRAARHVIDPTKLVEGVRKVYGDETFDALYGNIKPVAKERVRIMEDAETIDLGVGRPLQFIHTRGHAKHHFVVHDPMSKSVFTGDAFGVSYRPVLKQFRLENKAKPFRFLGMSFGALPDSMQDFLFPSSSPVDFEPKEAHLAIDKILATKAERAFVTHGGVWEDMKLGAMQMHYGIQQYSLIMQELIAKIKDAERRGIPLDEDVLHTHALAKMRQFFEEELQKHGLKHEEPAVWDLLNSDIELNAQGLVVAAHNFKDTNNF
jgi:glyoxylase-like metal-dependent hydrolase (beta-lactamase superfamily II)